MLASREWSSPPEVGNLHPMVLVKPSNAFAKSTRWFSKMDGVQMAKPPNGF